MTDAWVGRLACGDHSLPALAGAHTHSRTLYRETRRLGLQDGALQASVPALIYLPIQVWSRGTIAVAYASGLATVQRYQDALDVLNEPDLASDAHTALWRQFITAALYHRSGRWPDLCAATDICPPATATYVPQEPLAAIQTLRGIALAAIGQFQSALDALAPVATSTPAIAADAALTRGWCLRELGDPAAARRRVSDRHHRRPPDRGSPRRAGSSRLPHADHRRRHHRHPHRPVGPRPKPAAVPAPPPPWPKNAARSSLMPKHASTNSSDWKTSKSKSPCGAPNCRSSSSLPNRAKPSPPPAGNTWSSKALQAPRRRRSPASSLRFCSGWAS